MDLKARVIALSQHTTVRALAVCGILLYLVNSNVDLNSTVFVYRWKKWLQALWYYSMHKIKQRMNPKMRIGTKEWVQAVLRENGELPRDLQINITSGVIGGFIGNMVKIDLSSSMPLPTQRIIVKTIDSTLHTRHFSLLIRNAREALFYRHFAKQLRELVPRAFYANGNLETGDQVVVLEDLSQTTVLCGQLLGNQCWGKVETPITVEPIVVLQTIFMRAADMHAKYFRDKSLFQHSWMKNMDWLQGDNRVAWEYAMQNMRDRWSAIKSAVVAKTTAVVWPPQLVKAVDEALSATSWNAWHTILDLGDESVPWTLTHGDFHANNVLWRTDVDRGFYLIDWPEIGIGLPFTEIAQFMISNATIELRRQHEEQLFTAYYQRLISYGNVDPKIFTRDVCFQRYKEGGIERWVQMLVILAGINLRDPTRLTDEAMTWFNNQATAFIDDHIASCQRRSLVSVYCLN